MGGAGRSRLVAVALTAGGWLVLGGFLAGGAVASSHLAPGDPGACRTCHGTPSGGAVASAPNDNRLCYSCHSDAQGPVFDRAFFEQGAHGLLWRTKSRTPYARGAQTLERRGLCVNCHDPHDQATGRSLTWAGTSLDSTALCTSCHLDTQAYGAWPGPRVYAESPHGNPLTGVSRGKGKWATGECLNCHDPHGVGYQKLLNAPRDDDFCLVSGCHDAAGNGGLWPGRAAYQAALGVHGNPPAVAKAGVRRTYPGRDEVAGGCTNCHNPHGALDPRTGRLTAGLTNAAGAELCYQCHAELRYTFASLSHHRVDEPGSDLSCRSCHNPHVVSRLGQTVSDPDRPGTALAADDAFCLRCHDGSFGFAANVQRELGSPTAPGSFYGGERTRNLHYAHVTERNSRCTSCHDPHGSGNRALIKAGIRLDLPGYPNKNGCSGSPSGAICH